MTLRDYFAAKIMGAFCSRVEEDDPLIEDWDEDHLATQSYRLADAMLKARQS
jgi:hypothetical protein